MFVINQLLGTVLMNPDWDTIIQWNLKYLVFGVGVIAVIYLDDVLNAVNTFTGYANG